MQVVWFGFGEHKRGLQVYDAVLRPKFRPTLFCSACWRQRTPLKDSALGVVCGPVYQKRPCCSRGQPDTVVPSSSPKRKKAFMDYSCLAVQTVVYDTPGTHKTSNSQTISHPLCLRLQEHKSRWFQPWNWNSVQHVLLIWASMATSFLNRQDTDWMCVKSWGIKMCVSL